MTKRSPRGWTAGPAAQQGSGRIGWRWWRAPGSWMLIGLIHLYRWSLSPLKTVLFGPAGKCRFEPSCSAYALQAIRFHGAWKGSVMAGRRVCRCHPWGSAGWDPVPGPEVDLNFLGQHRTGVPREIRLQSGRRSLSQRA